MPRNAQRSHSQSRSNQQNQRHLQPNQRWDGDRSSNQGNRPWNDHRPSDQWRQGQLPSRQDHGNYVDESAEQLWRDNDERTRFADSYERGFDETSERSYPDRRSQQTTSSRSYDTDFYGSRGPGSAYEHQHEGRNEGQYDNQYGGEYGSSEFGSSGSGMSYTGGLSRSRQRYGSAPSSLGATRNRPSDMTGGYPEEPWRSMSANPSAREYYGSGSSSSSTSSRRGKAPRGYKRSDERIREDICERMMDNGELDASDVEIEVHEGVVKLSGNCSCRHSKNAIEEIVDGVSGVNDIDNQIKVKRSNGKDDESSSSTSTTSQSAKSGIGAAATSQGSSLGGSGAQTSRTRG